MLGLLIGSVFSLTHRAPHLVRISQCTILIVTKNDDEVVVGTGVNDTEISPYRHTSDLDIPAKIEVDRHVYRVTEISSFAFANSNIKSIILPNSVTEIGKFAFFNCPVIESADLSSSKITYLPEKVFNNCPMLSIINLPSSLSNVEVGAISGCGILTLKLPKSIQFIADGAFTDNAKLTTVDMSSIILQSVPKDCFANCVSLETFRFSPTLTTIEEGAFRNTGFPSLELPTSVAVVSPFTYANCNALQYVDFTRSAIDSIPDHLFYDCAKLSVIVLPRDLKSIGKSPFCGTAITVFTMPTSVSSIAAGSLSNCRQLKSVDLSNADMSELPVDFLSNCSSLEFIQFPAGLQVLREGSLRGTAFTTLTLPSSISEIGRNALRATRLTSIDLSQTSIAKLEEGVLAQCSKLRDVSLPLTCSEIGKAAFSGCGFATYSVPPFIKKIGPAAFAQCESLTSADLSASTLEMLEPHIFHGCIELTAIRFPTTLKHIGNYSFAHTGFNKLIVPATVTSLGSHCFVGCRRLTSVNLSLARIEEIPGFAFAQCERLVNMILPTGVRKIGELAFSRAIISNMELPPTVSELAKGAFAESQIENVKFTANLVSVGPGAFRQCFRLFTVNMSESVLDTIPHSCFLQCKLLKEVTLPPNLIAIGPQAFAGTDIERLDLSKTGVTVIDEGAFARCQKLTVVDLPTKLKTIGAAAFQFTPVKSVGFPETLEDIGQSAFMNSSITAAALGRTPLTEIRSGVFQGCGDLMSVELPAKLEKIGSLAFSGTKMPNLKMPSTLRTIETSAFRYSGLSKLDLRGTQVTELSESVFSDTKQITELILPEGLTVIGECALSHSSISKLVAPSSLYEIRANGFDACDHLEAIDLTNTNLHILGESVFYNTSNLKQIKLPDVLEEIGSFCFSYSAVKQLKLPKGARNVGRLAFYECTGLERVDLSSSPLEDIPHGMFMSCSKLKEVVFPRALVHIDSEAFAFTALQKIALEKATRVVSGAAFANSKLTEADLSQSSLSELSNSVFFNCQSLQKLLLPPGLTSLKNFSLEGCGLKKFIAPETLSYLGLRTFAHCNNLTEIDLSQSSVVAIADSCFMSSANLGVVKLPPCIERIMDTAFYGTCITSFEANLSYMGGHAFHFCTQLQLVNLSTSTFKRLAVGTFAQCTSLKRIILPDSLAKIGEFAFSNCTKLKYADLSHTNVSIIARWAFKNCIKLEHVFLPLTIDKIDVFALVGTESLQTMYYCGNRPVFPKGRLHNTHPHVRVPDAYNADRFVGLVVRRTGNCPRMIEKTLREVENENSV